MLKNQIPQVVAWPLPVDDGQGGELFLDLFRYDRLDFLGAFAEGWCSSAGFEHGHLGGCLYRLAIGVDKSLRPDNLEIH